jgi:4-amino-4-deoxy-L-arabinose transferase-like glycosyltransferase
MRTGGVFLAIVTLAGVLRLHGATSARITYDESLMLALAEPVASASGRWGVGPSDHPPLGIWLVRASGTLFASSVPGLRGVSVLCGAATVLVVYLLGRRLWGERAGLLAAALLAVDRFHASWSRLLVEESPLLLLVALALLLAVRAVNAGTLDADSSETPPPARLRAWAAVGAALGLAALAKETALLLLPALAIALATTPAGRRSLRGPGPVLAALVTAACVGLELARSLPQFPAGVVGRVMLLGERAAGPSPIATSPYLGELYRWWIGPDVLDPDYAQGAAFATFWPVGLFYLVAALVALRRPLPPDRLPLVVFWVLFAFFTLTGGRGALDPYWWASPTLVPGVLLGGRLLDRALAALPRRRAGLAAMLALLALLALASAATLARPGAGAPRLSRAEWAARLAQDGAGYLASGALSVALEQAQLSITLEPEGPGRALLLRLLDSPEAVRATPRFLGRVRAVWSAREVPSR